MNRSSSSGPASSRRRSRRWRPSPGPATSAYSQDLSPTLVVPQPGDNPDAARHIQTIDAAGLSVSRRQLMSTRASSPRQGTASTAWTWKCRAQSDPQAEQRLLHCPRLRIHIFGRPGLGLRDPLIQPFDAVLHHPDLCQHLRIGCGLRQPKCGTDALHKLTLAGSRDRIAGSVAAPGSSAAASEAVR